MQPSLRTLLSGTALAGIVLMAGSAVADTVRVTVAEYSQRTGPYFEEAAAAFEAANPGTDIQIEVVPWDVLQQKLTTDISAGANADLAIIGTRWLIDYVDAGVAEPLDAYMTDEFRDRFFETFLTPSIMDGSTYGLPIAASARAMYYNETLLEEAGVEAPPATWDELVEAARAVSALGDDIYGFGLQGKEIETDVYFYYAMWSFGGDILTEDGGSGLGSDAAVEAANLYKMMIDEGLTQPGVTAYNREDVQNLFKQGRIGMMITAPFLRTQIAEEAPDLAYGVVPVPAGVTSATYGVTDSIIMFSNSDVKDEAWAFLDFIFQTEWRTQFTIGEGFLPVTKGEAADPFFVNDETLAPFTEMLPDARFAPVIPGWEEIADATGRALQTIYLGSGQAADVLSAAASEVDGIIGANR